MMELVFEIGCEDLPARFVDPALEQLEEVFAEACEERRVEASEIETVGTPRRLALLVDSLAETQEDLEETQTGPPVEAAYSEGEPTGAAEGFAGAHGVAVDDLFEVEKEHGEYVAAEVREEGRPVVELLPEILDVTLRALSFPKSMRWASYDERFGRPVRWIVAVAGGEVVPVEFAGAESSARTRGHRFAAPDPIEVRSIEEYEARLAEAHVTVDPEKRRREIERHLEELADQVDGEVVEDPGLVDEVVHLVEEPHSTRLDFDEKYLELPDEVLIESMRSHQRYFAIESEEGGELLPHCGVIYNTPVEEPEVVNRGNLRVLRARLEDGMFFWNKDLERSLESRRGDLEDVVWLEEVGSMRERADRIGQTARRVADLVGLDEETVSRAGRAGALSKSDLATEMVGEFPKLQGIMGREYALRDGEPDEVAVAIREQYLPRGADDVLPETDAGACVALAEKLDALVGCFGVEMEPTADSDPFGLRRAALGVLRILEDRQFTVGLSELLGEASSTYADRGTELSVEGAEIVDRLESFVLRRLRYLLVDEYPTDVVDAVLEATSGDVVGVRGRVEALAEFYGDPEFEELVEGYERVSSILRDEQVEPGAPARPDPERFEEDAERRLFESAQRSSSAMDRAVEETDWGAGADALVSLKDPVDEFFERVRVNVDDAALRENRIRLLAAIRRLFNRFADVSKIS